MIPQCLTLPRLWASTCIRPKSRIILSSPALTRAHQISRRLAEIIPVPFPTCKQKFALLGQLLTIASSILRVCRTSPLSDKEFDIKILTAMQCADRVGPLLSVRRWYSPPAQGTNPSTSQLTPAGNFNPDEGKASLVIKFSSATVRDSVISRCIKLKDVPADNILGSGGQNRIYDTTVMMRSNPKSPLIPILAREEHFTPPPCQPRVPPPALPYTDADPHFDNTPEYLISEIEIGTVPLLLATVYRRPSDAYPHEFFNTISQFIPKYQHVLITGDFNINKASVSSSSTSFFNLYDSYNFKPLSFEPTHHVTYHDTGTHDTCIDIFLVCNDEALISPRKSSAPFTDGHDFLEIDYNLKCQVAKPKTVEVRRLNNVMSYMDS
ncbi:hypothetical protein QAD02_003385 [Eretmocerus hayati]|uniref:Uncharacterized protein n=1 Tax=Eretmocerus hayati TaxID=131215 RepID=A0ACC2NLY0_9HYME|nr:hypothetical protein QAD02_003385 [Eretmocerus hayati]